MNPRFAEYTGKIIKALPYWFKIKKNSKESNGALFLNATGLELDNIKFVLDYAYDQTRIQLADTTTISVIYKAIMPMSLKATDITSVTTTSLTLTEAPNLSYFLESTLNGGDYTGVSMDLFFKDPDVNVIFVKQKYDIDVENPNGKISYVVNGVTYNGKLLKHQIWNFFDEFGLLFDCSRLAFETDIRYKDRLLDVLKNPAGSHKDGLLNGLARELDLRHNVTILDGGQDCYINYKMVVLNSIKLDGVTVPMEKIFIDDDNRIVILGDLAYNNIERTLSFVHDIEMHQMHNKQDYKLYNELFNADGSSTVLLKHYKEKILSMSPIAWDYFRWDESYWNISDSETGGNAFIPNFYDAKIGGFINY